jgi:hypothetical protein
MSHSKKISTKAAKIAALEDMRKNSVNYQVLFSARNFKHYPKEIVIRIKTH